MTSCISGLFKVVINKFKKTLFISLYMAQVNVKSAIIGKIKFIYVMLSKYCNINVIIWPVRQI